MADYGNNFTSNSGYFKFNTSGHPESATDWVRLKTLRRNTYIYCDNTENIYNNVTTYGQNYPVSYIETPSSVTSTDGWMYSYFYFKENRNVKGSITGTFTVYPFNDKSSSKLVEPTKLDDTSHGVSPYSNSNNNALTRSGLSIKGTRDTRGYRRSKVHYKPVVPDDTTTYKSSKYGNNIVFCNDGTSSNHATVETVSQYDGWQTFYNEVDPYAVLSVSISNHDDAKSSSPTFCTLTNNKSEYRISHSYTYNSYVDSATWNNTNYLSFTYNTLPTYPKSLVFTYGNNWNSMSYDGASITVQAKARYNNSYDRFTTSTANDDGFSSYKRYVDVTYSLAINHSSTNPTGISSYTFRIWQPGSTLGISYSWSIDNNPSWAHLSTTQGNTTIVTFDDQGDDKPSVGGTLSVTGLTTTLSNSGTTSGKVSGNTWVAPTNKNSRSCVLRQNMTVTNCIAQNITPKYTSNNQPYQTLTLTQQSMYWNNPRFNMNWKVTQVSKHSSSTDTDQTSTYTDDYAHGWPTVTFGNVSATDGTAKATEWKYNTTEKAVSITMPTISRPWVNTQSNGTVTITKDDGNFAYNKTDSKTVTLDPDITFINGYTSGVSERKWKITNTSNTNLEQEYGSVGKFNDVTIILSGQKATDHAFGWAKVEYSNSNTTYFSMSDSSKSWTNDNTDKTFTVAPKSMNLPTIGTWSASASNGTMTFTSTTENAGSRSTTITFTGSTYQDGTITPSPASLKFTQNGTNISGTIAISGTGTGIVSCATSVAYPIDGITKTAKYVLKRPTQKYLNGEGNISVSADNLSWNDTVITVSGNGSPDKESVGSYPAKITVSSDIVSTRPSNHSNGVILDTTISDKAAQYTWQYKKDTDKWQTSNKFTVTTNPAVSGSAFNANCTIKSSPSISGGVWDTSNGKENYSNSRSFTITGKVIDSNDTSITYTTDPITVTQSGTGGATRTANYKFTITGTNCSVSRTDGNRTSGSNIPTWTETKNTSAPAWDGDTSKNITSNGIQYVSGSRSYSGISGAPKNTGELNETKYKSFTSYDDKKFTFGVSDSTISWTSDLQSDVKYNWYFRSKATASSNSSTSNKPNTESWTSAWSEGGKNVSDNPSGSITYHLYVSWDGGQSYGQKYTKDITPKASDRAAEKSWSYSWLWKVATSATAEAYGTGWSGSGSFYLAFADGTVYKYQVFIYCGSSGSETSITIEHTAFDDNPSSFPLSTHVVCQCATSTDGGSTYGSWETVSGSPTYSWSGGSTSGTSSSTTATVSAGSDGSSGNDTTVTCTATWNGVTASCSFTLKNYGKTYYNA